MRACRVVLPFAAVSLIAATLPKTRPEEAGLSTERLQRVSALVKRYIDSSEIAGAVSLVSRRGHLVMLEAQGVMDLETRKPMPTDAIFRLASMTKPVTSIAVMMLHEEGRFLLDDPVSKFLPEFKSPKVAVANAPNERYEGGYRLVPADREITIRDLLTHTAGLASGTAGPTMDAVRKLNASRKPEDLLSDYIHRLAELPLNFQPGTAWEYGPATDVLGRLVEVLSGQSLDAFFRSRILGPLAMNDTFFYLPPDRVPRLTTAYTKQDGQLKKLPGSGPANPNGRFFSGAGGLAGTAEDYLKFCQMLLFNGRARGALDTKPLVSRKTVEMMTSNQIGKLPLWLDSYRGYGFGLGFRIREDLGQSPTLGSVGEYGWGGAYGTYFSIDPKEQLIGILMMQLMPYSHLNIRPEFQNAINQAIID